MATPITHVNNPMRVAAPNQILHSFLMLFLLFTSSVSQDSQIKLPRSAAISRGKKSAASTAVPRESPLPLQPTLFVPFASPVPVHLPQPARTHIRSSLLADSLRHHKSVPSKYETMPAPWDLASPHARQPSAGQIPAWPSPHPDPASPLSRFPTRPVPGPDISSALFEPRPLPRADFSPRCGARPPSAP